MSSITSSVDTPARRSIARTCDDLAIALLAVITVAVLLTFKNYGLGWDDYTHAEYAELLLKLYGSGFRDHTALSFVNLYMYGGGFDMAAALLHKVLPLELFETRRLLGGLVGVVGIGLTWRLGRRVGGPVAGLVSLVLITVCPAFYGHIFMNPKDMPFAFAMVVLLLGLVRLVEEYPAPTPRTVLILGLGAGLSLGCRILGGFALVYALIGFIPLLLDEVKTQGVREATHRLVRTCYVLIPGLLFGYLVMGLVWPWSIVEPANPIHALTYFSAFFEKPWKELFNGTLVSVPDMPWSYLPTMFTLKMPEVLQALLAVGLVIAIGSQFRKDVPAKRKMILSVIALAAMLPLMIAMVKRPALYNGIRHFLFVIPPMVVLAGLGFAWIVDRVKKQGAMAVAGVAGVFLAGVSLPLTEMIRLHPYQYVYFNHAAGTVRAADSLYMLDYWGLALKQASEDLRQQLEERQEVPPMGRPWKVAVCGPQKPAQIALGPEFAISWDSKAADFAMTLGEFYCKGLNAPVLAEVKRDEVVFARVYDIRGTSIPDLLAIPAPQ